MKLCAIILTRNEEMNIRECLASLAWVGEILVVDSGSTDRTTEIAIGLGARVIKHPLKDFSDQRNFAINEAKGDWVLFVDADERVTPELAEEIRKTVSAKNVLAVYAIPRHTYFFGQRLRFCDSRGDAPIRLFPRSGVSWTQPVHEKIVTELPIRRLDSPLSHFSTRDLAHYMQKFRLYVPLELETMTAKGIRPSIVNCILRPPARFFQVYFLKLGILDGIAGLQYAILSAYYTFEKHRRYLRAGK